MIWSIPKLTLLDWFLRWTAQRLWQMAQDAVALLMQRNDLSGAEKRALAHANLTASAQDAGLELTNSMANFLIESAVQYWRGNDDED